MRYCDRSISREWVDDAVRLIEADAQRSADTHLLRYPLPPEWGVRLYLKDESTHPTGSLKHRLARSLFLYAICNGWVREETAVVEASSGSTAISEAYFAKLLGLDFVAVMPAEHVAGEDRTDRGAGRPLSFRRAIPPDVYAEALRLAAECGGHYMDQFTYAERATDWRGNNNIAESIFSRWRGDSSDSGLDGRRCGDGRYQRHHRPLHPLSPPRHQAGRGRSGELRVLRRLRGR